MNLGENIKKARKAAGVTQKELAERLQVYQKDISRWENNELTPNAITLAKICRELNASADEILEGLMEADVDVRDVEEEDGEITVYADQDQFHAVQTALNEMGITEFEVAELTMLPTSTVELEGDALAKFLKLLDVLEDLDDVQQVHHNVELPEEEE